MTPLWREDSGGALLAVHVQPGARREGIEAVAADRLRVRVSAPPEGGRANARLVELLAEAFGLPRSRVEVVSGPASRRKTVRLAGLGAAEASRRLEALLAGTPPPRT